MMKAMEDGIAIQAPLVSREALAAFTQRLVETFAPEQVILFGSMARGEARWDSDADILVVMPFEGRHLAMIRQIRKACRAGFPMDLLVRRPEEIAIRYRGGGPGELPPEAPTDPYVTLSRHPAPVIQPPPHQHHASGQTDPGTLLSNSRQNLPTTAAMPQQSSLCFWRSQALSPH
jgi:predicted nucleotidyltransferase